MVTRMLTIRRGAIVVIPLLMASTLAACGSDSEGSGDSDSFVIGASLPLTGVYGQYGTITKNGLEVGIDRVNAEGGIDGRQVELEIRDDASEPDQTLRAVRELVERDQVDFVMPGYISAQALAALPYTSSKKVLTITGSSTPELGDPNEYPYQFILGDLSSKRVPAMASAAAQLLAESSGTKVGLIVSDTPPQVALADGLDEVLPDYGLQVAGYEKVAPDATNLTPQLARLREGGAELVIFDNLAKGAIRTIMTGVQTLGWDADVLVGPGMVNTDLAAEVPAEVAKQFHAVNYRFATAVGGELDPATQEYIDELAEKGDITSPTLSATLTDLVYYVKWAYENAEGDDPDGAALTEALETLGETDDYPDDYTLVYDNPGFSPEDHTTNDADYSQFWALVGAVKPENGVYEGEALQLVEP